MRHFCISVCIVLLVSPELLARNHDWSKLSTVKRGTSIVVFLRTGEMVEGSLDGVSSTALVIAGRDYRGGFLQDVARADVRKVIQIRHAFLPDPHAWIVGGTLIGAGIGATAGAIGDIAHGNNGRWVVGGLAGAGLGFFAACVTAAGIGVVAMFHRDRVLYEDSTNNSVIAPPLSRSLRQGGNFEFQNRNRSELRTTPPDPVTSSAVEEPGF